MAPDPGLFAWVVLAAAALPAVMTLVNFAFFRRLPAAARRPASGVSVVIPARDEEANIGPALAAVLANAGVELDVIVADDSSTDSTAAIVAGIAAGDPRVRLQRVPPLPPGWSGKQHACHAAAAVARSPLLLFVDADVRLAQDALARIARQFESRGIALLSGFPHQRTEGVVETMVVPLIHVLLLGYLPMALLRWTRLPSAGAGCGQLIAVRRDAYAAAGGHGAIRASHHDGLTLPRAFLRAGLATDIFDASDIATCRMYAGAAATWRGFAKNADEGMATPLALPVWTALLGLGHVAPFVLLVVAVLSGDAGMRMTAAAAVGLVLASRIAIALRFKHKAAAVLLHPAGVAVLLAIQWTALLDRWRGLPVRWRARSYR